MTKKWTDMLKIGSKAGSKAGRPAQKGDYYIPGKGPKPKMTPEQKKKQEKSRKEFEKATSKHIANQKPGKAKPTGPTVKPPKGSKVKEKKDKRQEAWRSRTRTRR